MFLRYQGAKKVSFTACHSSKLYLACSSPKVISTRLKKIDEQDWLQIVIWIPPNKPLADQAS